TTNRNANPEGQGEVTMLDLMQSSLRMRPDRIILGEIRRHREAEVLFEAMHTGHSVYSTLHANSAQQVLERLIQPPISIPALEVAAIDLVLVQYRDRRTNVRRTFELSEIESGVSDNSLAINTIFKWSPRDDSWESMNPATKFVRNLNLHTGMTESEIASELTDRASILQWMLDNEITEINEVGKVMNMFYSDADLVKKTAKKNESPKNILEG
ncbi:Flp pilus assembly complex ATPase component TadA, partial [archaeon]|nr:Flp pilus assembly complex ATPase component TadA [archaeon]